MQIVNLMIKNNFLYPWITENIKYIFYFQDYLCALDGINILTHISAVESAEYQNQREVLL